MRNPQFIEHLGEYPNGDQFAVHQHAVAIENHQTEFFITQLTAARCKNMSATNAKYFNTTALAAIVAKADPLKCPFSWECYNQFVESLKEVQGVSSSGDITGPRSRKGSNQTKILFKR